MRRPIVEWMNRTDVAILEILEDSNLTLSPRILAEELDKDRQYVQKRCRLLMEAALVRKEARGLYRITDLGIRYVTGDAERDEIPDPEDI